MIQAGQKFGEFEILEQIGRGGMGAVFKARQTTLRRFVAIKILQPALASNSQYIIRFNNEAVAAAGLNHPNLVQVHAAGETDGVHWFAMEFVEGETVRARLKRKGRIEPAEAIAIATHVATALEYGWRKAQLIHRDIKPDNIFLSEDGEVKLGDLGLAKSSAQDDGLTITGASMGTPRYISPEQAQGKKDIDLRADIYSLGCTLFHLLSGQQPYVAENAVEMMLKHVTEPVPALRSVWPECPAELSRVVMKMMAKPPASRQQTHVEVIADLRRAHDAFTGASMPDVIALSQPPRSLKKVAVFSLPDPPARPVARPPAPAARQPAVPTPVPKVVVTPPTDSDPPSASAKPKSKVLLWSGIAAVLAVALWFAFGKKEPQLSEAERAETARQSNPALQRADGLKPPAASPAVEKWQDMLHDTAKLTQNGTLDVTPDGVRYSGSTALAKMRDGAVRMRAGYERTGYGFMRLMVRSSTYTGGYQMHIWRDKILLERYVATTPQPDRLQRYTLETKLEAGQEYEAELRAVGDRITASFNGKVVATLTDSTFAEGDVSLMSEDRSKPTLIKSLEVLNLDTPAASPSSAASSLAWKKVTLPDAQTLREAEASLTADGELHVEKKGLAMPDIQGRDLVVRGEFRRQAASCANIKLRTGRATSRRLAVYSDKALLQLAGNNQYPVLTEARIPAPLDFDGKWVPFQFAVINETSIATVGSLTLAVARSEEALEAGGLMLYGHHAVGGADFRNLEYQILDGVPEDQWPEFVRTALAKKAASTRSKPSSSAASPATATKDAPFVNTLGMKFVPVPITGGATGGQRVLFCVWDTRVQDYDVFAKETKREWLKADFEQGPTHPAVNVSWEDATAFCTWLTDRERKAGKIAAKESYRLPSDHEWSCAVGIGEREDGAKLPNEKNKKIPVVFPWGSTWPPPETVGNYWSEELRPLLATRKWVTGEIADRRDGYAATAPVGSFAANRFGLYDTGGNVWQWCEDWFDAERQDRVLRGASWQNFDKGNLLSSYRIEKVPTLRNDSTGFRCVMAVSAP